LTSVGAQHLEYFGSLDNIRKAKYELIESLPENGIAFLNRDLEVIRNQPPATRARCVYFGLESQDLDYSAREISFTAQGSKFTVYNYRGESAVIHTRLLGRHNIYNILVAVAVAGELGWDLRSIAAAVARVKPVPHRLEIKASNPGVTVIDDSFNSNPAGAESALEVLGKMDGKVKILITPGMVELGDQEFVLNRAFGFNAARVCDYVILVGEKQSAAIKEGLKEAEFPDDKIAVVPSLAEAMRHLEVINRSGSVILFENDLPDNY
jgi:UDP-N-acetylmuramoyl-tripeptide--D-alanyl-D-alanine ligase